MKKKIFLLLAIVAALTLAFVACTDEPEVTAPAATDEVTDAPTDAITDEPTAEPTDAPTAAPTDAPTAAPTDAPTAAPTDAPTEAPTEPGLAKPEDAGKKGISFDTLYINGGDYFNTAATGNVNVKLAEVDNTIIFQFDEEHNTMMLRGWVGFEGQAVDSFGYYINDYKSIVYGDFAVPPAAAEAEALKGAGGEFATRYEITVPLAELDYGIYSIGYVAKLADGTEVLMYDEIKVVIVPYMVEEALALGVKTGPAFTTGADKTFGHRGQIGSNILLKVGIDNLATYSDGSVNTWSFKVWQWDTDYATTTAAKPLFVKTGENHTDCATFVVDIPAELMISGDIYYEIEYLSGSGGFTGWGASDVVPGLETYVSGTLRTDGSYAAYIVVGVPSEYVEEVIPEHQLQNAPVYIIKAKDMMLSSPNQISMTKQEGYNHFVPTGPDPNFMLFNNQTGSRYVVIKYRTEYHANLQVYLGSEGSGPKDDTTMLQDVLNSDGEWHLLILDTQELVDRGVYDGSTAAYLRFDVMEAGYILNEDGEPFRDANGTWQKEPLPNGATIDIAYLAFFDSVEKANAYEYGGAETPEA